MNKPFGIESQRKLKQCHPTLQKFAERVNQVIQCTVITGSRTKEEQREKVRKKLSKTMNSKHLIQLDGFSHAIDLAPDPVEWNRKGYDLDMLYFAGIAMGIAAEMGIRLRCGADWNRNQKTSDESFKDYGHFELED